MTEPLIAPLSGRGVLAVTGADAAKFLNGLVTNDLAPLGVGEAAHAGLLSPQGKILFDFLALRVTGGFLLDVARTKSAELMKRLSMYKLRADVSLADASDDFTVFALWGEGAASSGETRNTYAFLDPRHAALGRRILAERAFAADIAAATSGREVPEDAYHALRMALGVPEGGRDYDFGDAYPHEADFDLFGGVSFTKGCYVGQEIVARMQHKSVVRKRVVRVEGDEPLAAGTDVTDGGAVIGRIGSTDGRHALALVRLDRFIEAEAKEEGAVRAGGIRLALHKDDRARYAASVASREKA